MTNQPAVVEAASLDDDEPALHAHHSAENVTLLTAAPTPPEVQPTALFLIRPLTLPMTLNFNPLRAGWRDPYIREKVEGQLVQKTEFEWKQTDGRSRLHYLSCQRGR